MCTFNVRCRTAPRRGPILLSRMRQVAEVALPRFIGLHLIFPFFYQKRKSTSFLLLTEATAHKKRKCALPPLRGTAYSLS